MHQKRRSAQNNKTSRHMKQQNDVYGTKCICSHNTHTHIHNTQTHTHTQTSIQSPSHINSTNKIILTTKKDGILFLPQTPFPFTHLPFSPSSALLTEVSDCNIFICGWRMCSHSQAISAKCCVVVEHFPSVSPSVSRDL